MNLNLTRSLSVPALICAALLPLAAIAADQQPDPLPVLRKAVDEVLAMAYDKTPNPEPLAVRVRPILEKNFNFESITRRAVGPGWKQFKPDQQKRATRLFADLVIRTYADRFEPGVQPGITYAPSVDLATNRRELPTSIDYAGKKYAVAYRMELLDGAWRIYDVLIEGVSMIQNYRGQFESLFEKGGADEVLRALETKLAAVSK